MSLTWTNRTVLSAAGNETLGAAVSPAGTCIVHRFNNVGSSIIWRSTDGGVTWNQTDLAHNIFNGGTGYTVYNNGVWYTGSYPGSIFISTDDGVTWARVSTGVGQNAGSHAATTDRSHTFVMGENSSNEMTWTVDDGAHFNNYGTLPAAFFACRSIIYDGTQFVAITVDSGPTTISVFTAPGGFTAVSGPAWTSVGSTSRQLGGASDEGQVFGFSSVFGYLACYDVAGAGNWVLSSTPAGLMTNSPMTNPLPTSNSASRLATVQNGVAFISNIAGEFAESSDGSTWTVDASNFQAVSNPPDFPAYVLYDATNGVYIAIGQKGNVSTAAAVPGISVTPLTANVAVNGGQQQFTANVSADSSTVTWSVDGIPNGNATVGFIGGNGLYQAPQGLTGMPAVLTHTITATLADGLAGPASAVVTLIAPTITIAAVMATAGKLSGAAAAAQAGELSGNSAALGNFAAGGVFPPSVVANTGTINPKIYMPLENTTIRSES